MDIVERHRLAADKAIGNAGRAVGYTPIKTRDQLSAYLAMTPLDFDLISKTYGVDQALGYIARMEQIRAGG